jgi:hypothetical protein
VVDVKRPLLNHRPVAPIGIYSTRVISSVEESSE